jgi:quercetin dioxygenase-like cupin family protein
MMNITRVVADEGGQTHFVDVVLPSLADPGDGVGGRRRSLRDIPTTTLNVNEMVDPLGQIDSHVAPRRQMIVVLRGAFEITTSRGERKRFECGDCLLAEDVEGEGHRFEDVGEELLATLAIGIDAEWEVPGA